MSSAPCILAIDLGTSGPKVALVSTQGELLGSEFEPTHLHLLPHGGAEQSPHDWWQAITSASRRLLAKSPVAPDRIVGVCCTSQWSGTVAVDVAGEPLMNAVIWMDTRGAPHVRAISRGLVNIEGYGASKLMHWLQSTGGAPGHSGKDSLAHILYLKQERPEIYQATYKFLEPLDYLNLKLTGLFAASTCSITLHWVTDNRDIHHIDYDAGLLHMAGLDRAQLPDLKLPTDVLGPLTPAAAQALGLPAGLPVVMGAPDVHTAAIGSGAVKDFSAHLYVGTSSWLIGHVPFKKCNIVQNMASLPSAIPGRYLLMNEQEVAGDALSFLRDNILYPDDALRTELPPADLFMRLDQLAASVEAGSGKLIFTPWLYGERTPVENASLRGGFHNMSLRTTRAHMVRAVLEGVAFNSRWLLDAVEKFMGTSLPAINFIGGGAKSPLWCQIFADILQRPIRQMQSPLHANARGTAMLASVGLGLGNFDDLAEHIEVSHVYTPNAENRAIYDSLYNEFLQIYRCNKKIYGRLNAQ